MLGQRVDDPVGDRRAQLADDLMGAEHPAQPADPLSGEPQVLLEDARRQRPQHVEGLVVGARDGAEDHPVGDREEPGEISLIVDLAAPEEARQRAHLLGDRVRLGPGEEQHRIDHEVLGRGLEHLGVGDHEGELEGEEPAPLELMHGPLREVHVAVRGVAARREPQLPQHLLGRGAEQMHRVGPAEVRRQVRHVRLVDVHDELGVGRSEVLADGVELERRGVGGLGRHGTEAATARAAWRPLAGTATTFVAAPRRAAAWTTAARCPVRSAADPRGTAPAPPPPPALAPQA